MPVFTDFEGDGWMGWLRREGDKTWKREGNVPHKKGAQIGQLEVNVEVYMWQLSFYTNAYHTIPLTVFFRCILWRGKHTIWGQFPIKGMSTCLVRWRKWGKDIVQHVVRLIFLVPLGNNGRGLIITIWRQCRGILYLKPKDGRRRRKDDFSLALVEGFFMDIGIVEANLWAI
jgi:hypothetical protein